MGLFEDDTSDYSETKYVLSDGFVGNKWNRTSFYVTFVLY